MERFNETQGSESRETNSNENFEDREQYLPLITADESRTVETSGGEYRGFVEGADGRKEFEDFLISRHSYYDQTQRGLVEAFIATETINEEGGNELEAPDDAQGFSTIITRTSPLGNSVAAPQIFKLSLRDMAPAHANINALRRLAHKMHRYALDNVARLKPAELEEQIETLLSHNGLRRPLR